MQPRPLSELGNRQQRSVWAEHPDPTSACCALDRHPVCYPLRIRDRNLDRRHVYQRVIEGDHLAADRLPSIGSAGQLGELLQCERVLDGERAACGAAQPLEVTPAAELSTDIAR